MTQELERVADELAAARNLPHPIGFNYKAEEH